jgi:hypothetical protein
VENPRPVASHDRDGRGADTDDEIQPGPATRHRVRRALESHERARRHGDERGGLRCEGGRRGPQLPPLLGESRPDRLARRIPLGLEPRIHLRQQDVVDGRERRAGGNRDERLLGHEDLAALPLPFGDGVFDDGHADAVPLRHQQLVQPRGGQPLLAAGPLARFGE